MRQNRELAKANSTQSLRIRSLELDISRLLADNLELRERVLQLETELHNAQIKTSEGMVRSVKEQLLAKLGELVDGIEALKAPAQRRETGMKDKVQGQWRERQPLVEAMRENQMPTIAEDKLYPRRTLGADELQAIRLSGHSSQESPDLGPPPIAHFDYEDPVKQMSPSVARAARPALDEEPDLPAALSVNLETRRKRRDGQPRLEIRRHSVVSQSPSKADVEPSLILRTGTKRKLADRDLEKPIKPPARDDFTFSRKIPSDDAKAQPEPVQSPRSPKLSPEELAPLPSLDIAAPLLKHTRKVLGEKSTNLSPRKAPARSQKPDDVHGIEKPPSAFRPPNSAARTQSRARCASFIPVPTPADAPALETPEIALPQLPPEPLQEDCPPPETPAMPTIFSPTPSEASVKTSTAFVNRDTPPPSDLSSLSTSTTESGGTSGVGGRQSRRARSTAVNYAEPSLVAKMRRPGKQMSDAIAGLQDHRSAMSASSVMMEKEKRARKRAVKVEPKAEDEEGEDVSWKNLPLLDGSSDVVVAESVSATEPRSEDLDTEIPTTQLQEDLATTYTAVPPSPTSDRTERQRRLRSATTTVANHQVPPEDEIDVAAHKLAELDLYSFNNASSPSAQTTTAGPVAKGLQQRRHSSVSKNSLRGSADTATSAAPHDAESIAVAVASRHSTLSTMSLPDAGTVPGPGAAVVGAGRSERAASRRRSMML